MFYKIKEIDIIKKTCSLNYKKHVYYKNMINKRQNYNIYDISLAGLNRIKNNFLISDSKNKEKKDFLVLNYKSVYNKKASLHIKFVKKINLTEEDKNTVHKQIFVKIVKDFFFRFICIKNTKRSFINNIYKSAEKLYNNITEENINNIFSLDDEERKKSLMSILNQIKNHPKNTEEELINMLKISIQKRYSSHFINNKIEYKLNYSISISNYF